MTHQHTSRHSSIGHQFALRRILVQALRDLDEALSLDGISPKRLASYDGQTPICPNCHADLGPSSLSPWHEPTEGCTARVPIPAATDIPDCSESSATFVLGAAKGGQNCAAGCFLDRDHIAVGVVDEAGKPEDPIQKVARRLGDNLHQDPKAITIRRVGGVGK